MGGIMIVISIVVTTVIMVLRISPGTIGFEFGLLLFVLLGYGLLGFLDDFIKVAMKRNLGLTSKQKMLGQIIIALIFYFILVRQDFPTYIQIPGTDIQFELGWAYAILIIFMLVGSSDRKSTRLNSSHVKISDA